MPRRAALTVAISAIVATVLAPGALAADPGESKQWALPIIGVPEARAAGIGAGITIAVVDTGVDLAHEDLVGRLLSGRNFVTPGSPPQDDEGHGTHVTGIAAASADNGKGVAGVAPGARILPVKVLAEDGSGTSADVNAGIRWAADQGAHVINLSLGDSTQFVFGPDFDDAIRYAWSKGSICVVAAGNAFVTSSGFADEPAIVVSATDRNDGKPAYSSSVGEAQWGIAAPGGAGLLSEQNDVYSTIWTGGRTNSYGYLAGTSMAAPHVAGAAAVLRGLGLSPQQTVDRLLATAKDIGTAGRDSTFGAGRLDLGRAVRGIAKPAPTSATPTTGRPPTRGAAAPAATSRTTARPASTTTTQRPAPARRPATSAARPATTAAPTTAASTTASLPAASPTSVLAPETTVAPDLESAAAPAPAPAQDDTSGTNVAPLEVLLLAVVALGGAGLLLALKRRRDGTPPV